MKVKIGLQKSEEMKEFPLGKEAFSFVDAIVPKTSSLSREVIELKGPWQFSAVAPIGTPRSRLNEFEVGGLCRTSDSLNWLVSKIALDANSYGTLTFLVDDLYAKITDPWVQKKNIEHVQVSGSVILFARCNQKHLSIVVDALRYAKSFYVVAMVLRAEVDCLSVKAIAANVLYILVSAYDQESFLIGYPQQA